MKKTMARREFIKKTAAASAAVGVSKFAIGGQAGKLAMLGGTPVMNKEQSDSCQEMFFWPRVNDAMRKASDDVLVQRKMSGRDIAIEFEKKFAEWNGTKYALSTINGTTALNMAFYAIGLKPGDEVICPDITMWASIMGAVNIGVQPIFCDVLERDLCIDPDSFEAHITPRTKAVVVVHYMGSPCDMDRIMAIANKHGIKVIEDVSHAQGGLYKGRKLGTFGCCGAMSLMSGKSFAIGEAGMLVTDDEEIYKRCIRWGMYIRVPATFAKAALVNTWDVPFGGIKNRLNQCTAAVGLEQLKKYDKECAEIEKAMMYYWDGIKDIKGLDIIYPHWYEKSNKAGWYATRGHYDPQAFGGLPNRVFAAAVRAEGGFMGAGCNYPMHWSSVYFDEDIFGNGLPPTKRHLPAGVDARRITGKLPVAETVNERIIGDPWFKLFQKEKIDRCIEAVHKVADNWESLLCKKDMKIGYDYWS